MYLTASSLVLAAGLASGVVASSDSTAVSQSNGDTSSRSPGSVVSFYPMSGSPYLTTMAEETKTRTFSSTVIDGTTVVQGYTVVPDPDPAYVSSVLSAYSKSFASAEPSATSPNQSCLFDKDLRCTIWTSGLDLSRMSTITTLDVRQAPITTKEPATITTKPDVVTFPDTPSTSLVTIHERDLESHLVPKLCSGSDMSKKEIAGTCMDGNFLEWSGNDCNKWCQRDLTGKFSCSVPSDCGPYDEVVKYCEKNANFSCSCMKGGLMTRTRPHIKSATSLSIKSSILPSSGSPRVSTLPQATARDVLGVPQIGPQWLSEDGHPYRPKFVTLLSSTVSKPRVSHLEERERKPKCSGVDKMKSHPIGGCPKNIGVYLNAYYCEAHCVCNGDGTMKCNAYEPEGIKECGGDKAAAKFCLSNTKSWDCTC